MTNDPKARQDGAVQDDSRLEFSVHPDPARNLARVELVGRLDIFTYMDLAKQLESLAAGKPGLRLLVDLSRVSFVASSGWSVFIATRARLRRTEGRMAFIGMQENLHRVYESMKMPELVPAFPDAESAFTALSEAGA